MRNKHLVPWLGQMFLGFACFLGGLEVARRSGWDAQWEFSAAGAALSALGLLLIVVVEMRERPQRVLRKARRSLSFPTQWAVKFDKNVPQGGVIPVAVIRSDGVRFVIDIQDFANADWNDPLIDEPLLVGPRGRKFKTDPVAPLMKAAEAWGATAILWLPEARAPRNLRQEGCNLIVVMGGARELKHVLRGAEIAPRRNNGDFEMTMPLLRPSRPRSSSKAVAAATELA
jgi:hypothetical protein